MANNTVTLPDVRFASGFLDKRYKNYAENGEVVIDKITGELLLKRKADGKLKSYTQNDKYIHDLMVELRILMQNYTNFTYPANKLGSYFMSVDYNVQDIMNNVSNPTNVLSGASLTFNKDAISDEYRIRFYNSLSSNGFCVRPIPRDTDKHIIEYLSGLYNATFKNYSGSNSTYRAEANKFTSDDTWELNNATMYYTVRTYGVAENDSTGTIVSSDISSSVNVTIDRETMVFLPTGYANGFSSVSYVEIFITELSFPKLAAILNYMNNTGFDMSIYNSLLSPDEKAVIEHVNVFNFIDTGEHIPTASVANIIACVDGPAFISGILSIDKLTSATSYIVSETRPTTTWLNNNIWAETIREMTSPGVAVEMDHPTDLSELETWIYNSNGITTVFTFDETDSDAIYIEQG